MDDETKNRIATDKHLRSYATAAVLCAVCIFKWMVVIVFLGGGSPLNRAWIAQQMMAAIVLMVFAMLGQWIHRYRELTAVPQPSRHEKILAGIATGGLLAGAFWCLATCLSVFGQPPR